MSEYPPAAVDGELVDSIFVYHDASATGDCFSYIPRTLDCVLDSSGEPDIWIDVGDTHGIFYLKAQLAPGKELLASVRRDLELRHHLQEVTLQAGALGISSAKISFSEGNSLAISSVQPAPPFLCDYSGTLSATQRDAVISAMTGGSGNVSVVYQATLQLDCSATARIAGDLSEDINELIDWAKGGLFRRKRKVTEDVCSEQLEKAFSSGRLKKNIESTPNTPDALGRGALEELEREVVQKLLDALSDGGDSAPFNSYPIDLSKTRTDMQQVAITYSADLADWFADFNGASHVRKTNKPINPDSGGSGGKDDGGEGGDATLSLAATPDEIIDRRGQAILSSIKVTIGSKSYMLEGPQFRPVTIDAGLEGADMTVETTYARGSGFTHKGTYTGGALRLEQHMLGLQRVDIDASALPGARATTVTIQINYLPTSSGTRDQNTLRFDSTDKDWTASWWLVTRSDGLGGSLKWSWTAKTRVGGTLRQSTTNTTDTQLKLDPHGGD